MSLAIQEIWAFRYLLLNLTTKELKLKYKSSVLGFLWSYLNPLFMLIIYSLAFRIILHIQVANYTIFMFVGLLVWQFVQSGIVQAANSIVSNQQLVKKVYFPWIILPFSVTLANFTNMLITFVILFFFFLAYHMTFYPTLFFLPIILLLNLLMIVGLGALLSSLTVRYRDVSHLLDVIFIALFYMSPIIYELSMVPTRFRLLIEVNPFTQVLQIYRDVMIYGKLPSSGSIVLTTAYSIGFFLVGTYVFLRRQSSFAEDL